MYHSHEVTIFIKIFNLIQDMTRSHKILHTTLQEMELKDSIEFTPLENESMNLIATCEELRNYLNTAQSCHHK